MASLDRDSLVNGLDQACRIGPDDTNYFAMLFDPEEDAIQNVFVVEIFTTGGATPPKEHSIAHEFFHVRQCCGCAAPP